MKKAFTLAEVLITLGIIGVVAALVMPSLIAKHKEKETVSRLKKAYSALQQAFLMATAEEGTPDNWGMAGMYDAESHIILANHFKPYMKVLTDCVRQPTAFVRKNCVGNNTFSLSTSHASFVLQDGTTMIFRALFANCNVTYGTISNVCGTVTVDTNGAKQPNELGYDLFTIYITKNRLVPLGTDGDNKSFERSCDRHNANPVPDWQSKFAGCAAWVLYNENMDYLHCDDLSWNGKTKCK